jgi:rhomboid protease GluP
MTSASPPPNFEPPTTTGAPAEAAPAPALSKVEGPPVRVRLPAYPVRVTYVFLGLIILTFIGQFLSEQVLGVDALAAYGEKINEFIAQGEVWRLLTSVFLHGGILHLLFNAYALYVIGRQVETIYGPLRFSLVYLCAGLAGSVASLLLTPAPSLGASGALFGLIGAEAVFLYRNRKLLGERARRGLQNILFVALINLAIGLQGAFRIDNWAHIGGLLGGLSLSWFIGPLWAFRVDPVPGAQPTIEDQQPLTGARWIAVLMFGLVIIALTVLGIMGQR